jgi:hypothetical protein
MAAGALPNFRDQGVVSGSQYALLGQDEIRGILRDPAYTWRWVLVLPSIRGTVSQVYNAGNGGASMVSGGQQSTPNTPYGLAASVEIPPDDLGTEGRFGGATSLFYPRQCSTNDIQVSFYETKDYAMTRYLLAWKKEMVDADGLGLNNFGNPADYKKQIQFYAFDITSNSKSVMQFVITDSYPVSAVGGLSYGVDNGNLTVSCEFSVDGSAYTFTS